MDLNEMYHQSVTFLHPLLHRDPLRSYSRVRTISPPQRDTPRLREYWLDFTEEGLYFHNALQTMKTEIIHSFCQFAAFCAYFPLDYWQNDVIFTGIWLWHMSKWIVYPQMLTNIVTITARFSAYMEHTALSKNALTLLAYLDLDHLYDIIGGHLLPYINPQLPEVMLVRLFSHITMYLITRSLRLQDLISFCNMTTSQRAFGVRSILNYPLCGVEYYFGLLVWNAQSKESLHRQVRRYLGSLYFIANLNICQSVITFYALIPPHRQSEIETYLRRLYAAHYLHAWFLTPVHFDKIVHYDRTVATSTKIASLLEFNSPRLFTLRHPILHPYEKQILYHWESSREVGSISCDEFRVALLYDMLHTSNLQDGDLTSVYAMYTHFISNPISIPDFTSLWHSILAKKVISEDRSSTVFATHQSPTSLMIGMQFPTQPTFLHAYASMYSTFTPHDPFTSVFGIAMIISTFFFPFWCKQCYRYGSAFFMFDIEYLKPTDVREISMHIGDLLGSTRLSFPDSIPENMEDNALFPSALPEKRTSPPLESVTPEVIFPDFLLMRRFYFAHESIYEFTTLQQEKLAYFFTTLFTRFFAHENLYQRIDTTLIQEIKPALSALQLRRSHDSKLFLQLCTPFHRIFPAVLQNMRVQVILSAYWNLNPILCASHPLLQGIFQWGFLSCIYQTTATLSLVIMEYEIPQSIYDNPRSEFQRYWVECRRQFGADLQITMEPIDSCWYACNLSAYTASNLLSLSLVTLKQIKECDNLPNPYILQYIYSLLPPNSEITKSCLQPSFNLDNLDNSSHPIWWRDWFSSSFFLVTQAALRIGLIITKDSAWLRQKDRLLHFFQQFPGMWINNTPTYWIVQVDLGGIVREALTFIIAQLLTSHLNYEVCFPIDLRYNPPDLVHDFITVSRKAYHTRTHTWDVIEEPLFCYRSRHLLYPLAFRVRVHRILSEVLTTPHAKITSSRWGEITPIIDRYYQQWKDTGDLEEAVFKSDLEAIVR